MKKFIGFFLMILAFILFVLQIMAYFYARYSYENEIFSYWKLADKSSTLDAKSKYVKEFIDTLKKTKHSDYAVIIFKTPDLNFDNNLQALQTLSDRLESIKNMDEKSFEYQAAIQQITSQEQGEADQMLQVFRDCYLIENFIFCYDWICILVLILCAAIMFWGFFILATSENY